MLQLRKQPGPSSLWFAWCFSATGPFVTTFAFSAGSQPATAKPAKLTKPCSNKTCHTSLVNRKGMQRLTVHNECYACHQVADPANHTFKLLAKQEKLCGDCHPLQHGAGSIYRSRKASAPPAMIRMFRTIKRCCGPIPLATCA